MRSLVGLIASTISNTRVSATKNLDLVCRSPILTLISRCPKTIILYFVADINSVEFDFPV